MTCVEGGLMGGCGGVVCATRKHRSTLCAMAQTPDTFSTYIENTDGERRQEGITDDGGGKQQLPLCPYRAMRQRRRLLRPSLGFVTTSRSRRLSMIPAVGWLITGAWSHHQATIGLRKASLTTRQNPGRLQEEREASSGQACQASFDCCKLRGADRV